MVERVKRGALYDDVIEAPDDKIAEIVHGDLYLSPRPGPRHTNASSLLGAELVEAFHRGRRGPGGWWILDEPELHLGFDILVPDIAGFRRDRMPELPASAWFEIAPDWLCEVISASTERLDRDKKLPIYARAGVEHLWIVDPTVKTLEVLRRVAGEWRTIARHSGQVTISEPPFEAVAIELGPLWS